MNIKAGIEKLEEIRIDTDSDLSDVPCFETIRKVLVAMDTPTEDKQFTNKYQDVALELRNINFRIECIEAKRGCKVKFKEEIEKRVEALDLRFREHYHDPYDNKSVCIPGCNDDEPAPTKPCGCLVGHECAGDAQKECIGQDADFAGHNYRPSITFHGKMACHRCGIVQKDKPTQSVKPLCQLIGVMTTDGSMWCETCDDWHKVIKPELDPSVKPNPDGLDYLRKAYKENEKIFPVKPSETITEDGIYKFLTEFCEGIRTQKDLDRSGFVLLPSERRLFAEQFKSALNATGSNL